jgi:hypothetical protein
MVLAKSAFEFSVAVDEATFEVFDETCEFAVFFWALPDIFALNQKFV